MAVASNDTPLGLLRRHPQAVAWGVLVASFAAFLTACGAVTFFAYWFLFDSQVDLKVSLQVSKGSLQVSYFEGAEDRLIGSGIDIEGAATIRGNESAQGYLTFIDNYSRRIIATVYLMPDTVVSVRRALRPRFDFSGRSYHLTLSDSVGEMRVEVPEALGRSIDLRIGGAFGEAHFTRDGDYHLDVSSSRMALSVYGGSAMLRNAANQTWQVPAQQMGTLQREGLAGAIVPFPYLVLNKGFGEKATVSSDPRLPSGWGCTQTADNETDNRWARELTPDARVGLRLIRALRSDSPDDGIRTHGETGCLYTLKEDADKYRNITSYKSLRIRARVMIRDQSLSTCGDQGTECPVMLFLEFTRPPCTGDGLCTGDVWRHGFYAKRPNDDWRPLLCDTCVQLHERITPNVWYFYDSGDLLTVLGRARRPVGLKSITVYSSGHAYDVIVSELQVIVGTVDENGS
jgi:hypothetical protein